MRCLRMHLFMFALAPVAWGSGSVQADWWPYTETVYTSPASMAYLPTSYLAASSYLVPTTSVVPTVYATAYYAETSTWTPTAYVESAYVPTTSYYVSERVARRPLFSRMFGRRRDYIVPTTIYYPTTAVVPTTARYYAPTVLEYPVLSDVRYQSVANSCGTCDDSVVVASAPTQQIERRVVRDEESSPRIEESPKRSAVESDALDDTSTTSSKVQPAPEPEPADLSPIQKPAASETKSTKVEPKPAQPVQVSPPIAPAAAPTNTSPSVRSSAPLQPDTAKSVQAGKSVDTQREVDLPPPAKLPAQDELAKPGDIDLPPPVAPSGPNDADLPVNEKSTPKSRESLKPVLELPRPTGLTLLKGRVRSSASAEPEEGVRITVSSRTNAFEDRTARSNEAGKFAMRVPDGDWTVKVTMPSGRVYPVYRITVSGGIIIDDQGRDIPGLVIER